MKENYNYSTPSVSYTTAMDLLAGKLAIHARSTGKNADRALNDALVHARDAAHASAYSRLLSACGRDAALNHSEDIAQTVAVRLFDGKVRARIISNLPKLKSAEDRKRWFGKVIAFTSFSAMRSGMRGPKFISLDDRDERSPGRSISDFVDMLSAPQSLLPDQALSMLETIEGMLGDLNAHWQSTKSATSVTDWSPADEIIGKADETDRPDEERLSKRTRQRRQQEAEDIAREWRKRLDGPQAGEGPGL